MTILEPKFNQIRITFFTVPKSEGESFGGLNLWEKIAQEKPDSILQNPKNNSFQEQGIINNFNLTVGGDASRLDVVLDSLDPLMSLPIPFSAIANKLELYVDSLEDYISKLKVVRFGLFVRFSEKMEDKVSSYESISRRLNIKVDGAKASDFIYRINYPRDVEGIETNAISTWSTAALTTQTLNFNNNIPATISEISYAENIEIDVNTSPNDISIKDVQKIKALISIYVSIAQDIYMNGPRGSNVTTIN